MSDGVRHRCAIVSDAACATGVMSADVCRPSSWPPCNCFPPDYHNDFDDHMLPPPTTARLHHEARLGTPSALIVELSITMRLEKE